MDSMAAAERRMAASKHDGVQTEPIVTPALLTHKAEVTRGMAATCACKKILPRAQCWPQ
jgi:hypothetical protein